MATPIMTGNHPRALYLGVRKWVMNDYTQHPMEYTALYSVHKSKQAYEDDVQVNEFPLARVRPQGASTEYVGHEQGPTTRYRHIAYSLGIIVTKEEIDDNLYEKTAFKRAKMLTRSFRIRKEIVAANVLNRGFDSAYPGGDGKPLFATDHPNPGGAQSNMLAVPADLSEASLEDLLTQIAEAKSPAGYPIALRGLKLVVPPALHADAIRITKSELQNDTANNAVNAIRNMGLLPEGVVVNHYLTDPDAWFVITDAPDGLSMFERTPFVFTRDNDFDTDNAKSKGYERYSVGYTDFRGPYGSAGA